MFAISYMIIQNFAAVRSSILEMVLLWGCQTVSQTVLVCTSNKKVSGPCQVNDFCAANETLRPFLLLCCWTWETVGCLFTGNP